jgi:hypothetical protein
MGKLLGSSTAMHLNMQDTPKSLATFDAFWRKCVHH